MNNEILEYSLREVANRVRNVLDESKGKVLDDGLLNKIDDICRGMGIDISNMNNETERSIENAKAGGTPGDFVERRDHKRRVSDNDNIMDAIGIGLCLLDRDLKIVWANGTICEWLDLKESPVGCSCHNIYNCYEIREGSCPATKVFKGDSGSIIETWIMAKDKKRRCVQHVATPITSKEGAINNVLILTVDVTEREKLVQRLLQLQQLGEIMQGTLHLDKLLHLILTCVTTGYAFGFNRAFLFLIEKEYNVLRGKLAIGPSSAEEAGQIWQEISVKYNSLTNVIEKLSYSHNIDTPLNTITKLMVYPLSDGIEVVTTCVKEKKPIIVKEAVNDPRVTEEFRKALGVNEFVCVPLVAKDEPIGVIVADNAYTGEPITEDMINILTMFANQAALAIDNIETYNRLEDKIKQLTETQQILVNTERLATIGSMASYVAHEIRNPLVTIGGFAKSLSRFTFTDSKIRGNINIIIEEVKRLEKILNNITEFSKPLITEKSKVQICEIMEDTCALMRNYFYEKYVNLCMEFEPNIPKILADPNQIKQVLLNTLMNAVESMPDGGSITVKIGTVNESIKIDVADTGKGMLPEELKNIFDPFFTTKSNGTGVGMTVSLKIIEDHGGNINVKSEYGKGTTISLSLPIDYKKEA